MVLDQRLIRLPSRAGEYWWVGVGIPFGLGAWATFLYLGLCLRRPALTACGGAYLLGVVGGVVLNLAAHDTGTLSNVAAVLWLVTWGVSIVHATAIRHRVRGALDGARAQPPVEISAAEHELQTFLWHVTAVLIVGVVFCASVGGALAGTGGTLIGLLLGAVPAGIMLARRR